MECSCSQSRSHLCASRDRAQHHAATAERMSVAGDHGAQIIVSVHSYRFFNPAMDERVTETARNDFPIRHAEKRCRVGAVLFHFRR